MQVVIRRATVDDAELLSRLSIQTFCDTFRGTCTDDDLEEFVQTYFNATQILTELKDANDYYFIAFLNEAAAGYLRLKEEESDVDIIKKYRSVELKRIYVLNEYLSQKIGAALMNFVLQFAEANNYEAIWLGVWEHNERAKAFYNKWGFTYTGSKHPFPIGKTPQTDEWLIKVIE